MSNEEHRLALPSGYTLGKYHFLRMLGSGGFGITYLAEDGTLHRRVAIKELLPNDIATRLGDTTVSAKTTSDEEGLAWARERFVNEGRALAACEHPNVVHVYEIIEANGTAYMVTKFEEGCSLEKWLRNLGRTPTEKELRDILMPLLSGLEKVHAKNFLHRDIKPDNIYIADGYRPLLLDFGSARQAVSNRSMAMTSIVTGGYAPFEQYYEDGNQGPWSDIYALAAVIYRAMVGSKPPEATRRIKHDTCEKLAVKFAGQYSENFLKAIDRALDMNEASRPQNVAEWRAMIEGTWKESDHLLASPADVPADDVTVIQKKPQPPVFTKPALEKTELPAPKAEPPTREVTAPVPATALAPAGAGRHQFWIAPLAGIGAFALAAGIWSLIGKSKPEAAPAPAPVSMAQTIIPATPTPEPIPPAPSPTAIPDSAFLTETAAGTSSSADSAEADTDDDSKNDAGAVTPEMAGSALPEASPLAGNTQIDSDIVGTWRTGATSAERTTWKLWSYGHWQKWGVTNDSGSFTTSDGKIQLVSYGTQQMEEATYKIEDGALTLQTPAGNTKWAHPPAKKKSTSKKAPAKKPNGVKAFFDNIFKKKK